MRPRCLRIALVAAVACAAAIAACGRDGRDGGTEAAAPSGSGGPAGVAGAHRDPIVRRALERACAGALQALAGRLADPGPFRDPGHTVEPVACADLYVEACGDAWRAMARHEADLARTVEACAAVYCPALAAPAPAACAPTDGPRDAAALVELDRRILADDGSAPATATALSVRGRLFAAITTTIEDDSLPPPTFMGATVMIDVRTDAYAVAGITFDRAALARRVADAVAADPDTRFVVTMDADVPYGRVVEALDVIKQAGGMHIAMSTR